MTLQSSLFWGLILLFIITSTFAFNIKCSKYDSDFESQTVTCNAPSEYCGIDRTTGAIQGCVPASQCPATVSDNRIIVCDASKSSCCCLDSGNGDKIDCNDILHPNDDSQWKQACSISLLQSPADVCKVNPTRRVFCAFKNYYAESAECRPYEFCGIAKSDGEMKKCLPPKECPSSGAKGSKQIVCDGSASHCCCQDVVDQSGSQAPCNYIQNERDSTIWQQACSLNELSSLSICKEDPSKAVFCKSKDAADTVECSTSQLCGVDKSSGGLEECLDASQCPSSVTDKISCDSSKPFCCCQRVDNKHGKHGRPCNHILSKHDNTIWKQACSLPELASLSVCQEDPTKAVFCRQDGEFHTFQCKPSEFCGIDKTTGKMQKCLESSQCPAAAQSSEKIVCDDNAPNCCCQKVVNSIDDSEYACNFIEDDFGSSIWQQACKEEQLKNLLVCQHDPSKKRVYCQYHALQFHCLPFKFCGIAKRNGQMTQCLDASECPTGAQDSDKIVCDDSAPNCCCHVVYDLNDSEEHPILCNNIQNWKNTSVWKQACELKQLKDLEVCKAPPTEPPTRPPPPRPRPEENKKLEEEELADWEIALIVISVLVIMAVVVCVAFLFFRRRRRIAVGRGRAVQGQQTPTVAQNVQQQPIGNLPAQASQSAPLVPVNPAYQQPYAMSMPNMRYY